MSRRKSRTLTEVELEFMQIVWERREVTTEDMLEGLRRRGRHITDGSVRKILAILLAKGYLARRPEDRGKGFRYRPLVLRDKANNSLLADIVDRAFGGSACLMVAALLDSRKVSKTDLARIKRLIAEREKQS
ncbi:MAG: hypothetical protein AMJ81_06685 [Phycisphaerae bacterium SM23_33]|jgi:BlaI family penicillinase repressor|nr:MAG: hypothetical protein AMJ81_06685 [Phycisphaerae bacterium SM23_33]